MKTSAVFLFCLLLICSCRKEERKPDSRERSKDDLPENGSIGLTVYRIDSVYIYWPFLGFKKELDYPIHYISMVNDTIGYYHKIRGMQGTSIHSPNKRVVNFYHSKDSVNLTLEDSKPFICQVYKTDSLEYWENFDVRFYVVKESRDFLDIPQAYVVDTLIRQYYTLVEDGHAGYFQFGSSISIPEERYLFFEPNKWGFKDDKKDGFSFIEEIAFFQNEVVTTNGGGNVKVYERTIRKNGSEVWKSDKAVGPYPSSPEYFRFIRVLRRL